MTTTTTEKPKSNLLGSHHFVFNKNDNGGESIGVSTYIRDIDGTVKTQQEFFLQSYCNSAHILLNSSSLTADRCREVANELDKKWIQVKAEDPKPTGTKIARLEINLIPSPDGNILSLTTDFFENGDRLHGHPEGIYTNQKLSFARYDDIAYFGLAGASITAESLRQLANELDRFMIKTLPNPTNPALPIDG